MRSFLLALGLSMALVGCPGVGPNSQLVGAQCTANNQCQGQCITGDNNYPGGYCTVACQNDMQCPGGTQCIDDHGGICVYSCRTNQDCAAFGRGFVCDARDRRGTPGGTLVCRVP